LQVESANSNVTSPVSGQLIYNSTSNKINFFNGTGWISVPDGTGIGGNGTVGTIPVFNGVTEITDSQLITTGSGGSQTFLFNTSADVGFKGSINFDGAGGIKDKDGQLGTSGQLLSSTGTQLDWINAPVSYTKWLLGPSGNTIDVNDGDNVRLRESSVLPGVYPVEPATKSGTTITQDIGIFAKNMALSTPSNYSTDVLLWSPDTSATTWIVNKTKFTDVTISTWSKAEADIGMDGFKITDLGTPSAGTDAANKAYVDANAGTTYTLPVTSGTNAADIKLTDNGGTVASTVNISGTTNETTVGNLASGNITIGLPNNVTLTGDLTVSGGDITLGGTGRIQGVDTVSASTDAASKAYVDSSVAGGLNVKGGFNASTGAIASGGNLTSGGSRVAIAIGDYYVVTVAGNFFGNAATPLTPGDSVLVQTAAAAGASVESDFAVIQSDTDLATASTVGIGNVNVNGPGALDGLNLSYSSGTATVGVDIKNNAATFTALSEMLFLVYDGNNTGNNLAIDIDSLATYFAGNTGKQFVGTSSSATTHTFNHNLNSFNVIVQLYDTSTKETVYASVDRTSVNQVVATTASSASLTCLIDKIG